MRWATLLMMTTLLSPFGVGAETRSLPSLLQPRDASQKYPVWVAAREAFDHHGRLKTSHFYDAGPQFIDPREPSGRLVDGSWAVFWDLATKDCTGVSVDIIGCMSGVSTGSGRSVPSPGTFEELVGASESIQVGRIVDSEWGFSGSQAGSILEVEVETTFKGSTPERLLIFFYYARFATTTNRYCVGFVKPEIGARIVLFATHPPMDAQGILWYGVNRVIVEDDEGVARSNGLPGSGEIKDRSIDQLVVTIREITAN